MKYSAIIVVTVAFSAVTTATANQPPQVSWIPGDQSPATLTFASAGLINLQIDTDTGHGIPPGGWADNNQNGVIDASDDIYLVITMPAGACDGYDLGIDVTGPGTLMEYAGGPPVNHAPSPGMPPPIIYSGIGFDGNIDQICYYNFMSVWMGPIDLVWGLLLHCDGPGPVTLDLTLNGATRVDLGQGWIDLTEADLGDLVINVASAEDPWWLEEVVISPECPTSYDVVSIILSGEWPDACIPNASAISVVGNDIYFDVFVDYPPGTVCAQVLTGWELTESVGPLSPGTYTVYARLVGDPYVPETYEPVAEFVVTEGVPQTLYVPQEYTTIQQAVVASSCQDTIIIVAPGTYYENISFDGKNILLTSTDPNDPNVVEGTVIDGGGSGPVVTFSGTEPSSCKLTGFTITGGNTTQRGGGICGNDTLASISKCVIKNNSADSGGGLADCDGIIEKCIITGNSATSNGGGLAGCNAIISGCLIYDNSANSGGGLRQCHGDITNCTIVYNTEGLEGGSGLRACNGTINNCIVWGNATGQMYNTSEPTYSCVQDWADGGIGNINSNPLFTSGPLGDYYLSQTAAGQAGNSPCLDAGSDTAANLGMGIYTTRTDHVFDTGIVDMGYHYPAGIPPQVSWIPGDQSPATWTFTPAAPTTRDVIDFSGPTAVYDNACYAEMDAGGIPTLTVNHVNRIIELWFQPPAPETCPPDLNPVCGLQDSFGPLEAGGWTFIYNPLPSPGFFARFFLVSQYILNVPAEYPTIQAAIDDANDGDIVIVQPGTYVENINFLGKNITLRSTEPTNSDIVNSTTINGVVCFRGTEDSNCALTGFNIDGYIVGFDYLYGQNHTHATISHCVLQDNITGCDPAIQACDGTISNCVIARTSVMCLMLVPAISECHGLIKNCTIANNPDGVEIQVGGTCTIENCIIYHWTKVYVASGATLNISYSDLEGGLSGILGGGNVNWGPGNIDTDPLFADPNNGDYHLKSQAGRWEPVSESWVVDEVTSPCIDAGNPGCPVGEEPEANGDRINMGAYGGTAEASKSPTNWRSIADLTNDWVVNFDDVRIFVGHWLEGGQCIPADLNRNETVDLRDYAIFAGHSQ